MSWVRIQGLIVRLLLLYVCNDVFCTYVIGRFNVGCVLVIDAIKAVFRDKNSDDNNNILSDTEMNMIGQKDF